MIIDVWIRAAGAFSQVLRPFVLHCLCMRESQWSLTAFSAIKISEHNFIFEWNG